MKNWSFGKLMGVFAGSFVGLIIIVIIVMKITSGPVKGRTVTTRTPAQQQAQPPVDVLALELAKSQQTAKDALAAQQNSSNQLAIVRQEMQNNNAIFMGQFQKMNATMSDLKNRIDFMEASRGRVEIIKPPRKTLHTPANDSVPKIAKRLPESSGYKVQATVGNRAWIKSGVSEDSVIPGDKLPPVQKELRVRAVDNNSGIVITGPAS